MNEARYDGEAEALYVTLGAPIKPGGVVHTAHLNDSVNLDYAEGRLVGVEVLYVKLRPRKSVPV